MNPQRFAQCNTVMKAPSGMENCYDLHAARVVYPDGAPAVITAWRPTMEELVRINLGEPIWLSMIGETMQPVSIGLDSPFEKKAS